MIGIGKMSTIRIVTTLDFKMKLCHLSFRKELGVENMATDMWLLERASQWVAPAFRRYGWARPQITFGYGQKASWVERQTGKSLKELIRRPTGGGIVRHGSDLTYCMTMPKGSTGEQMSPMEFYGLIHQRWGDVLQENNIANCLMPCPRGAKSSIPGDCFNEPVRRDLMDERGEKKLGGAAMKRTRMGVLIQGTLALGDWPEIVHEQIEGRFLNLIASDLRMPITPKKWPDELAVERSKHLKTFSSLSWTSERKAP